MNMILNDTLKNFLEVNYTLLEDTNTVTEFFFIAYNGLSAKNQDLLVEILDTAGIDTREARKTVLRFIISMSFEVIARPVSVHNYVLKRSDYGFVGFSDDFVEKYIIENSDEWLDSVHICETEEGTFLINPKKE